MIRVETLSASPAVNTPPCWEFDPQQRRLSYGSVQLRLAPAECRLISALLGWPTGAIVPRNVLLSALSRSSIQNVLELAPNSASPPQRALNMTVSRLRHKVRQAGAILPLQTVSREGYALLSPITMVPSSNSRVEAEPHPAKAGLGANHRIR